MRRLIILSFGILACLAVTAQYNGPRESDMKYDALPDSVKAVVDHHFFDFEQMGVVKLSYEGDSVNYRLKFKARADLMTIYFNEAGQIVKREIDEDYEEEE